MNCPQCNTHSEPDANFCCSCGGRLGSPAPPVIAAATGHDEQEALRLLAQARERLDEGDAEAALMTTQAALALDPNSAECHLMLGEVFERLGRSSEAVSQYEMTLGLDPSSLAAAQKLDSLRLHAGSVPVTRAARSNWGLAAAATAGIVVFAGGFAMIASGAKRERPNASPAVSQRVGASLSPTHFTASGATGALAPTPLTAGSSMPQAAPPVTTGVPSQPFRVGGAPVGSLGPAGSAPAFNGGKTGQPVIRVGLPQVADTPQRKTNIPALAPATPRAMEPLPQGAPQANAAQPANAFGSPQANLAAPGRQEASTPNPSPAAFTAPQSTPESASVKKTGRGEPLEPDTGFIRIEPVKKPAPGDGSAQ